MEPNTQPINIFDRSVYKAFREQYLDYRVENETATWAEFVNSLSSEIGINLNHNLYEITDEKKWMVARIKYGI